MFLAIRYLVALHLFIFFSHPHRYSIALFFKVHNFFHQCIVSYYANDNDDNVSNGNDDNDDADDFLLIVNNDDDSDDGMFLLAGLERSTLELLNEEDEDPKCLHMTINCHDDDDEDDDYYCDNK